jgi:hypothetical protein
MDSPTGPLRLLIGVTGHLDLCDRHPDQLRAAVADALGLLGGPSRVPVVVLWLAAPTASSPAWRWKWGVS